MRGPGYDLKADLTYSISDGAEFLFHNIKLLCHMLCLEAIQPSQNFTFFSHIQCEEVFHSFYLTLSTCGLQLDYSLFLASRYLKFFLRCVVPQSFENRISPGIPMWPEMTRHPPWSHSQVECHVCCQGWSWRGMRGPISTWKPLSGIGKRLNMWAGSVLVQCTYNGGNM